MSKKKLKTDLTGVIGSDSRGFDQFFTKPHVADTCVKILNNIYGIKNFDIILEPSFGEGAFLDALKTIRGIVKKLIYYDIDAQDPKHKKDFLKDISYIPEANFHASVKLEHIKTKTLTIGNPPFGKNSSLAIAFFNQAARFSDVIAFIVPKTFCKDSVIDKLDRNFFLIHENVIEDDGFIFKSKTYNVPCVYQVWIHHSFFTYLGKDQPLNILRNLKKIKMQIPDDFVFVTPEENPDFAIRRVGVNAGKIFSEKVVECSKQSHFFIKCGDKMKDIVLDKLKSLKLEECVCKYNTAGCPSISKNELCNMYNNQMNQIKTKYI